MIVKFDIVVKCPMIPNFILTPDGSGKVAIQDLSDKHLRAIGKEWIKRLVELAQKRRKPGGAK